MNDWTCPRCNRDYDKAKRTCRPCLRAISYAEEHYPEEIETAGRPAHKPTEKGYLVADSAWVVREVAAHFLKEVTEVRKSA